MSSSHSQENNLFGLVLAGGKSTRMGQAKAYLNFGAGPQWQVCERVLRPFCSEVFFSVSPLLEPQLNVSEERLISDIFVNPIGPLGGIMSAFKKKLQPLLVLACDLPYFDEEAASFLVKHRNPEKNATAFVNADHIEPLCTIYEPRIFKELAVFWSLGVYCPRKILSSLDIERLTPRDERFSINVNHHHEFDAIREKNRERKTVKVYYFSSLREEANCSEESLQTLAGSVIELFSELQQKYSLTIDPRYLRFAKNDQLIDADEAIADNDEIAFLPPVSGG